MPWGGGGGEKKADLYFFEELQGTLGTQWSLQVGRVRILILRICLNATACFPLNATACVRSVDNRERVASRFTIAEPSPPCLPSRAAHRREHSHHLDEGPGGGLSQQRKYVKHFLCALTDIVRLHLTARTPALASGRAQWRTQGRSCLHERG
jgi:hypothetical protein